MKQAHFRFYAELNDFLPPEKRGRTFPSQFRGRVSVKDAIESLGVPHPEVDLILANGESVDFSYPVQDGDRISVYPVFESIDISPIVRVRPRPLREIRFLLDSHLGKLAVYLRLFGFDALYRNDYADEELARLASSERRVLLTRDRGLLKRTLVSHGYYVRETEPRRQVVEVLRRFDLSGSLAPLRRCLRCNSLLERVPKEAVSDRLPQKTRQYYDEFWLCRACERIYWKGSHFERMQELVECVLRASASSGIDRGHDERPGA